MPVAAPLAMSASARKRANRADALTLCASFERLGSCPDPVCSFAHGSEELQRRQAERRCVQCVSVCVYALALPYRMHSAFMARSWHAQALTHKITCRIRTQREKQAGR